ncbi:kinetochore-associated Ndc80 complex subunit nuf2 [Sorochytrium milnesiophthora]
MARIPNLNLRQQDVVATLNEFLRLQLSEDDLLRPQPMRMIAIYELLITKGLGVPAERFTVPSHKAVQHLEFPDTHDESLLEIQLYKYMSRFMCAIGIDDFSLRDILRPEPPRIKRILTITAAYLRHRAEQMVYFNKASAEYDRLTDGRTILENECAQHKEKLELLRVQREQEKALLEKAKEANSKLERETQSRVQYTEQFERALEDLKRQRDGIVAKYVNGENLKLLNKSVQDHIDKTKSKIVTNPEELKQVLATLRRSIEEEKTLETDTKAKIRTLGYKASMMETFHNELISLEESLRDCQAKKQQADDTRKQLDAAKEVLDKNKQELRDSNVRLQTCIKQVNVANDRIKRLKASCDPKVQQLADKSQRMERDHERTRREVADLLSRSDHCQIVAQDCTQQTQDLTRDAEADLAGLAHDFGQLKMQVDQYLAELMRGLQAPAVSGQPLQPPPVAIAAEKMSMRR